jgi:uncharacterized RDD family membrane protein YckC
MDGTTQVEFYPSLLRRIQSSVIDFLLILTLMITISQLAGQFENFPSSIRVILFILILLYEPISTTMGATLGQYIMKIRVRQYNDAEKKINLFQSIIRYIVKVMLGWLSFVSIHFNQEKRAIHDIFVSSVMIRLP